MTSRAQASDLEIFNLRYILMYLGIRYSPNDPLQCYPFFRDGSQ